MTFLRARIAAALPLVIADWRANGCAPSSRCAYVNEPEPKVLRDVLTEFDRRSLADDFESDEADLRNAYDLVTDPDNRELVDLVAAKLYPEG